MNFFPQFKWAVPVAFSDAISACRFERGDIFYDNIKGYERWDEALKFLKYSIQVHYPERQGGISQQVSASIFKNNWSSEARLELTDYENNRAKKYVYTTQGRLFTLLWRGDLDVLDMNAQEPSCPLLLSDAKNRLKDTFCKFQKKALEKMSDPVLFAMPYDSVNAALEEKYLKISNKLKNTFDFICIELTPEEAGVCDWQDLSPTISFKCFSINTTDLQKVCDILKDVLYKSLNDSSKNRFDINRHGLLIKV